MRSVGPVLAVVGAILVLWYLGAAAMNLPWERTQAERAGPFNRNGGNPHSMSPAFSKTPPLGEVDRFSRSAYERAAMVSASAFPCEFALGLRTRKHACLSAQDRRRPEDVSPR